MKIKSKKHIFNYIRKAMAIERLSYFDIAETKTNIKMTYTPYVIDKYVNHNGANNIHLLLSKAKIAFAKNVDTDTADFWLYVFGENDQNTLQYDIQKYYYEKDPYITYVYPPWFVAYMTDLKIYQRALDRVDLYEYDMRVSGWEDIGSIMDEPTL